MRLEERFVPATARIGGRVTIVEVHGPMVRDEGEPIVLLDALRAAVERGDLHIVLNVAEVATVDSLWLGALVQGYTTATRRAGSIKLVHVSRRFRELLAVTKLDRVLELYDSEADAVASFALT